MPQERGRELAGLAELKSLVANDSQYALPQLNPATSSQSPKERAWSGENILEPPFLRAKTFRNGYATRP